MNAKLEGLNPYLATSVRRRATGMTKAGCGATGTTRVVSETTIGPKRVDPLTVLQKQNRDQVGPTGTNRD